MNPKFEILTEEELRSKVNVIEYLGELCEDELYVEKAIFIEGDYEVNGDFTIDNISKLNNEADFLCINGNLKVKGNFNPEEETFPNMLILGNLDVDNIQNGEELLAVKGDVQVKNMIYGSYSHGGLKIYGKTSAKYVINYEHWMIIPNLKAEFIISPFENEIDTESDKLKYNILKKELFEKVKEEYITDGEELDEIENIYKKVKTVDIKKIVLDIRNEINIFKS